MNHHRPYRLAAFAAFCFLAGFFFVAFAALAPTPADAGPFGLFGTAPAGSCSGGQCQSGKCQQAVTGTAPKIPPVPATPAVPPQTQQPAKTQAAAPATQAAPPVAVKQKPAAVQKKIGWRLRRFFGG